MAKKSCRKCFSPCSSISCDEKPRSNLRGWAFRVAHNLGLKRRIAVSRRMEVSIDSDLETHVDSTLNPEEQAAAAQRQTRLEIHRARPPASRTAAASRYAPRAFVSGNRRNSRNVAGIGIGLLSSFSAPPRSRRQRLTVCGMLRIYRTKSFSWLQDGELSWRRRSAPRAFIWLSVATCRARCV